MATGQEDPTVTQFRRIERWLRANAATWLDGMRPMFNAPASPAELARLEARIGPLPGPLRALLEVHDGCRRGPYPLPVRATGVSWRLRPVSEIETSWDLCAEFASRAQGVPVRAEGPVAAVWWTPAWIPIAEDGAGNLICVDTRPPPGGTVGQLVSYLHDLGKRTVLYPSLEDCLRECADDFEAGRYEVVDEEIEERT